jgi:hypothetical protein
VPVQQLVVQPDGEVARAAHLKAAGQGRGALGPAAPAVAAKRRPPRPLSSCAQPLRLGGRGRRGGFKGRRSGSPPGTRACCT